MCWVVQTSKIARSHKKQTDECENPMLFLLHLSHQPNSAVTLLKICQPQWWNLGVLVTPRSNLSMRWVRDSSFLTDCFAGYLTRSSASKVQLQGFCEELLGGGVDWWSVGHQDQKCCSELRRASRLLVPTFFRLSATVSCSTHLERKLTTTTSGDSVLYSINVKVDGCGNFTKSQPPTRKSRRS